MDDVLALVEQWPVDTVAVGITDADHTLGTHGPAEQVFQWASVTKVLTAWATLVAVQDGHLHLDEPAGPEGATVRHLLAHASGLPPEPGGPSSAVERRRIYSNHGFEVLAELVADRVGEPFTAFLDAEVLTPLGMDATHLDGSPAHAARGPLVDLLALGRELLAPTLLDEPLATDVATVQFPGLSGVLPGYGRQDDNTWGLGVEIRGEKTPHWTGPSQPAATFGHFGQAGSFLWVDRDAGVAAGCLGDRDFDGWAVEAWRPFNERLWRTATG
jgi:CubicO group peptidase (beta-lactamase class C family)